MARIFPFQALRYDPNRVRLADVVTQPYDKITPAMQARYYDSSPYNLVRVILGRNGPDDGDSTNVYTRAGHAFTTWRNEGVLVADPQPAIYAYSQRFALPGAAAGSALIERRGFIALGQIESYDSRVVFRHEHTHAGPKADRLNLLRATRAHFGQLFMLYTDPDRQIERLLEPKTFNSNAAPEIDVSDEFDVQHRVWRVADARVLAGVERMMEDKRLIIADGHHRYETALAFRNEQRDHALKAVAVDTPAMGTGSFVWRPEWTAAERVMMTYVNMDSPGLVILPTHRVVSGLASFSAERFLAAAREFFAIEEISGGAEGYTDQLNKVPIGECAFVAALANSACVLRLKPGAAEGLLAELPPRQRALDVAVLHRVLLQQVLGISPEDVGSLKHVSYLREAGEAVDRVRGKAAVGRVSGSAEDAAQVAFLMKPVSMAQVRDIAFAGEVLPQKSTDFYPKMLSGLTIYALDQL